MNSIKVSIFDENKLYCSRITVGITVAGHVVVSTGTVIDNFEQVLSSGTKPDIVLMSRAMSGNNRIQWVKDKFPGIKVIILVLLGHADTIRALKKQKVEGIIVKSNGDPEEVLDIIKIVYNGGSYFPKGR